MKYKALLLLFLILILPFSALAADGEGEKSVKVVDASGNPRTDSIEKSENFSTPSNDESENEVNTELPEISVTKPGMLAGQEMIENSGKELAFWVGDQLGKGGFELASVEIQEKNITEAQTPRYTLYSKELKPFEAPAVRTFVILCAAFHIAVCFIFILLGVVVYNAQKTFPKAVSKMRSGFSGEESFFDIKSYMLVCGSVLLMPFVDYFGIWYELLNRNAIISMMTSKIVDVLMVASDNLPTYLLVNLSWYFNMLEKVCGEYTVHLMCSFLVIKSWIMAAILLFGSIKQAAILQASVMISFTLVLFMDIITLGFVFLGVNMGVEKENTGYILAGMLGACAVDFLILLGVAITVYIVFMRMCRGRL